MANPIATVAGDSKANAAALLLIAAYMGVAFSQGNASALITQVEGDFLGSQGKPGFWKWAVALLILYALAANPTLNPIFGPFLMIAIVAMLISLAENNPTALQSISNAIKGA